MKKILFTSLNDNVAWGGSEELWSKTALHLSKNYHTTAFVKKWNPVPKSIHMLKEAGVEIVYKHKPKQKKRSFFYKILRKLGLYTSKKNNEFSSLLQPSEYDLAILSVGNSWILKLPPIQIFFRYMIFLTCL